MADGNKNNRIPVLKPLLPPAEAILPYLQRIDETRWYSNRGPLLVEFEQGIADTVNVIPEGIACVSNGTLAITVALTAAGAVPGRKCLMPSWTFVGTVSAVITAGLEPYFVDVDIDSWALTPDQLYDRNDLDEIGAVVTVAPFGAPLDRAAWDRFTEQTGIPVVIDAAAAFDAIASTEMMKPGPTPMAVSLHATKTFGVGEGGFIVCTDSDLVQRARQIGNFGFYQISVAQISGWNAKLSEYAAAVGMACMDNWPDKRVAWERVTHKYQELLGSMDNVSLHPAYGDGWVSSYCCVRVKGDGHRVAKRLNDHGIDTRRWWRGGCHTHPGYMGIARDPLPATQALATTTIGLPFSIDLTDEQVEIVCSTLSTALN
ncbi:MAG: aminotransferase class I/II-fold pyridoxal phosphate-dependent enzyme [Alphaproteobacteria bacterium]|nr:aminotransferase class I/II-fold pyridoxal phosphate-dependent enzyme [Alphaproteobacteria bacterium SS10]